MPSAFLRPKKKAEEANKASTVSGLIPEEEVIPPRRPYASKSLRLSLEGRVSTRGGLFAQVLDREVPTDISMDGSSPPPVTVAGEGWVDETDQLDEDGANVLVREARAAKKQRQWRKWSEDVIPALLQPYMALLRETQGLRDVDSKRHVDSCSGCSRGRLFNVTCVYFESMHNFQSFFIFYADNYCRIGENYSLHLYRTGIAAFAAWIFPMCSTGALFGC